MVIFQRKEGSLTVEAALALPVFICVIMSIASFIKVVYVHELMQHTICETANQLSTYSYIYSASGIKEIHDQTVDGLDTHKEKLREQAAVLVDCADAVRAFPDEVGEAVGRTEETIRDRSIGQAVEELGRPVNELAEKFEKTRDVVKEITSDPKGELRSLICVFARAGLEDLKAELLLKPLSKALIVKHLGGKNVEDANRRLLGLNVVDGLDGLDLNESRLFEDKENIELVVRYRIKTNLPINLLPELQVVQRASVRAWTAGDERYGGESLEDIWALNDMERGRKIQEIYRRNLPYNFKAITRFQNGIATLVTSINLDADTYRQNSRTVVYRVNEKIRSLSDFEEDTKTADSNGRTVRYYINADDIRERRLVVVIPKKAEKESFRKVFSECIENAAKKGVKLVFEEL